MVVETDSSPPSAPMTHKPIRAQRGVQSRPAQNTGSLCEVPGRVAHTPVYSQAVCRYHRPQRACPLLGDSVRVARRSPRHPTGDRYCGVGAHTERESVDPSRRTRTPERGAPRSDGGQRVDRPRAQIQPGRDLDARRRRGRRHPHHERPAVVAPPLLPPRDAGRLLRAHVQLHDDRRGHLDGDLRRARRGRSAAGDSAQREAGVPRRGDLDRTALVHRGSDPAVGEHRAA